MARPKTKEEALLQMRLMWFAILMSILLYIYVGEMSPGIKWLNFQNTGKIFVILAVLNLVSFLWFRKKRYRAARDLAKEQPENTHAVRSWMNSWIILLSIADSEAVFGVCFRMGNKTLQQTLPFYAIGLLLTLSLWPPQPWSTK
ncbi:MAG: hypothetical protein ACYDDI_11145 [Candidatus Acidiferrales bacterium]